MGNIWVQWGLLWSQGVLEKADLLQKILHSLAPTHPMTSLSCFGHSYFLTVSQTG